MSKTNSLYIYIKNKTESPQVDLIKGAAFKEVYRFYTNNDHYASNTLSLHDWALGHRMFVISEWTENYIQNM